MMFAPRAPELLESHPEGVGAGICGTSQFA
jgi:hypothetical protein